jgi:hypothetical protein
MYGSDYRSKPKFCSDCGFALNLSRAPLTKFKVLDKDATSHDDLFDAFRFSLMFWY